MATSTASTISVDAKLAALLKDTLQEQQSSLIAPVNENIMIQPWVNPLHNLVVVIDHKGEVQCAL